MILRTLLGALGLMMLVFGQNCSNVKFAEAITEGKVEETLDDDQSRKISQTVEVKANSDVDILFVVDNSGSMQQEQVGFADKINGFMALVDGLNWRVALTTTSPTADTKDSAGVLQPWGDGQFRPLGTKLFLKSGEQTLAVAQAALATAIQVGLNGSGDESGIRAAYRALQRNPGDTFFRNNAALAIVVITDEDECSNAACLTTRPESVPENLVALVKTRFGGAKKFTYHSIIRRPNDATCTTGTIGATYVKISDLTSGVIGSVCATDYTSILNGIGTRIIELVKSVNLVCEPLDKSGDGVPEVNVVLANGQSHDYGANVVGKVLTLPAQLPEGVHALSYSCAP
jgi:hypothetical protein